jgi:hypothetical protein
LVKQPPLAPELLAAYRETEYRVTEGKSFLLRVDEPCPELLGLYRAKNVSCAAFITAWNPFSHKLTDAENAVQQNELASELKHRSLIYLEGVGQHPSGTWPGEPSFLVLGLALEAAKTLGRAYEQNAIVWCDADAVPGLVPLV